VTVLSPSRFMLMEPQMLTSEDRSDLTGGFTDCLRALAHLMCLQSSVPEKVGGAGSEPLAKRLRAGLNNPGWL